jgi:hypothetical protein
VEYLLSLGAEINVPDNHGNTAVEDAEANGQGVLANLLRYGISMEIQNFFLDRCDH